ncbi:hypothetical protein ACQ4PT_064618 [Festuca glaucescens]
MVKKVLLICLCKKKKKKGGRGPTELKKIYDRDQPKQRIILNEHGQPIGSNATTFANFIGTLVRKELSVLPEDWRYVDAKAKLNLWDDIKASYFDVDEAASNYVLTTTAKKWRDFKAELKKKFDATLTDEDNMKNARTTLGKQNRSKVTLLHVAGSKSFARTGHELGEELGYAPRRDEIFIKAYTRKSGVPTAQAAPLIVSQIHHASSEFYPELKEKPIQEGDLYAHVFGEKEPKGCVRVLGLGRTPQNVGTPGIKAKVPTKLAMEIELRQQAEQRASNLLDRMEELQRQFVEMQKVVYSQGSHNVETHSPHNSFSRPVLSSIAAHDGDEENDEQHDEVEHGYMCNGPNNQDEDLVIHKHVAAKHVPPRSVIAAPSNLQASRNQEESLVTFSTLSYIYHVVLVLFVIIHVYDIKSMIYVGRDVILYHLLRSEPVAKTTVISTNQYSMVGGGLQYYEVLVNVVLKRDVELARAYDGMKTMSDAHHMTIAWPSNKVRVVFFPALSSSYVNYGLMLINVNLLAPSQSSGMILLHFTCDMKTSCSAVIL